MNSFYHWIESQDSKELISIQKLMEGLPEKNYRSVLRQALKEEKLIRWSPRVYGIPRCSSFFEGYVFPGVPNVVECYANSKQWKYMRHPAYWINRLGVSTQVPMHDIFVKVGREHCLSLYRGNEVVTRVMFYEYVVPHALALCHRPIGAVLLCLYELGPEEAERWMYTMLKHFPTEEREALRDEEQSMPEWMRRIVGKGLKKFDNSVDKEC